MLRYTIGGAIILSAKLLPHTVFLQENKKFRSRYDFDNNEKPVRADIKERFEEVVTDLGLSPETKKNITLFSVHDLDVFHAGSSITKHGAIIGVPPNFEYKDADDITAETISFPGVNVDWSTQAGIEFRKSLILSDNAQKFAMAQRIITSAQYGIFYETYFLGMDLVVVCLVYEICRHKLYFIKNQKLGRFICAALCAIGGYISWLFSRSVIHEYIESAVNEELIKLGPQYIEGGVEYYEKLSARNKALRALLGIKGTYLFTPTGNKVSWFSQRGISICNQLSYFKSKLQDIELA